MFDVYIAVDAGDTAKLDSYLDRLEAIAGVESVSVKHVTHDDPIYGGDVVTAQVTVKVFSILESVRLRVQALIGH